MDRLKSIKLDQNASNSSNISQNGYESALEDSVGSVLYYSILNETQVSPNNHDIFANQTEIMMSTPRIGRSTLLTSTPFDKGTRAITSEMPAAAATTTFALDTLNNSAESENDLNDETLITNNSVPIITIEDCTSNMTGIFNESITIAKYNVPHHTTDSECSSNILLVQSSTSNTNEILNTQSAETTDTNNVLTIRTDESSSVVKKENIRPTRRSVTKRASLSVQFRTKQDILSAKRRKSFNRIKQDRLNGGTSTGESSAPTTNAYQRKRQTIHALNSRKTLIAKSSPVLKRGPRNPLATITDGDLVTKKTLSEQFRAKQDILISKRRKSSNRNKPTDLNEQTTAGGSTLQVSNANQRKRQTIHSLNSRKTIIALPAAIRETRTHAVTEQGPATKTTLSEQFLTKKNFLIAKRRKSQENEAAATGENSMKAYQRKRQTLHALNSRKPMIEKVSPAEDKVKIALAAITEQDQPPPYRVTRQSMRNTLFSVPEHDKPDSNEEAIGSQRNVVMFPKPSFTCDICLKSFLQFSNLNAHKRSHKAAHNCKYCDKKFSIDLALQNHMKENCVKIPSQDRKKLLEKNRKKPTSAITSADVPSKRTRKSTAVTMPHSGVLSTPNKKIQCQQCHLSFLDVLSYMNHIETHDTLDTEY